MREIIKFDQLTVKMTIDGNPGNRNYGGPSLEPGEIASAAGTRLTKRRVALAAQSNFG